jgi:hypothetical protein
MKFKGFEIGIWSILITLFTAIGLSGWIQGKEFMVINPACTELRLDSPPRGHCGVMVPHQVVAL